MVSVNNACDDPSSNTRIWSHVDEEWILVVPSRESLNAQVDQDEENGKRCSFCRGGHEYMDAMTSPRAIPSRHPMIQTGDGETTHYVIAYGGDHSDRLGDIELSMACDFLKLVGTLTERMFETPEVLSVYAFESVGDHFGPTVSHPHGQILGLPFVPRRLRLGAEPCPLCTGGHDEALTVTANDDAELLVSPWARVPFDLIARPARHVARVGSLTSGEIAALMRLVQLGLRLCTERYGSRPPYIVSVMQGPRGDDHHLRIEIMPLHKGPGALKRPGAMEIGLGVYINPVTPVHAAELLRADARRGGHDDP